MVRAPWCLIALVSAMQQPETYHTRPHPRARHRETSLHVGGWSVAISWASVGVVACAVGECMLVNLSRRSVLVRVQAREHSHLPDALHVLQYRREGACANYPRRARPPRIWVRFPSPKLGQKFLDFLQNKLSKSDFLTGRKNSILIPTRNADGMWSRWHWRSDCFFRDIMFWALGVNPWTI